MKQDLARLLPIELKYRCLSYLLERPSGVAAREVGQAVGVFRVSLHGSYDGALVAERARARARPQPRSHVHYAVKQRRLLHHAPRLRSPYARVRTLMSHNVPP